MITPDIGYKDIQDGESPMYTSDSSQPPYMSNPTGQVAAMGSGQDSDTVQGLLAVTASVAGPNKLVATDATGKLPSSILPAVSLPYTSGTLAALKASPPSTVSLALATDVGPYGAIYFYFNNSSVGDAGFVLLGGS